MPSTYLIVEVKVTDPDAYETYKAGTPGVIAKYEGEFIVRGGATEPLEGRPPEGRVVVVKFPSMEKAKAFYHSADYSELLKIRLAASDSRGFLVEGV